MGPRVQQCLFPAFVVNSVFNRHCHYKSIQLFVLKNKIYSLSSQFCLLLFYLFGTMFFPGQESYPTFIIHLSLIGSTHLLWTKMTIILWYFKIRLDYQYRSIKGSSVGQRRVPNVHQREPDTHTRRPQLGLFSK